MNNRFQSILTKTKRSKKWPLIALEIFLLIVSGWRTFDFISEIMGEIPLFQLYAVLTVVISEGSYLVWAKFAYPNADAGNQESVSIGMIGFNALGLLLLSFGENLIRATSGFSWASQAAGVISFTPWAMLGVNLIGVLLFGVLDDDHIDAKTKAAQERLDRNAARDLAHAERMGHIQAKLAAIEMITAQSDELARELAPYYFNDIRSRVSNSTLANLGVKNQTAAPPNRPKLQHEPQPVGADFIAPNGGGNNSRPKVI